MKATHCILLALFVVGAYADVYMHNPRGSNDRNCENNVNRNNGNRLFDSQNNAKGGYACPRNRGGPGTAQTKRTYYVGSQLPVEWTQQHGCGGNERVQCEIIVQYGCEDTMDPNGSLRSGTNIAAPRDGTPQNQNDAATDTIPNNQNNAVPNNAANRRFGMHETVEYYQECQNRARNKGLYTADQNLNRNDARATRQNPNGNRNGLECPEERDYYPHWAPNAWRDIAVLVRDEKDCETRKYATLSQNVTPKGRCKPNGGINGVKAGNGQWPNNQADCNARNDAKWVEERFYEGFNEQLDGPECKQGGYGRVNQLGNSIGNVIKANEGNVEAESGTNRYLWTIPNTVQDDCVLRLRYNVSQLAEGALPAWGENAMNASLNGDNAPIPQDPYVAINDANAKMFLQLRVNTNQLARTFQDRSYVFSIKARPAGIVGASCVGDAPCIMNVGVVGKRGNIVQTYPATEYDFAPSSVNMPVGDYAHFQWVGSDYGPQRGCNNGEGDGTEQGNKNDNARANRSNMVFQSNAADVVPIDMRDATVLAAASPVSAEASMSLAFQNQPRNQCLTLQQLNNLQAGNRRENNPRNCAKLNAQRIGYFNLEPQELVKEGSFKAISSRNNNFSNRGTPFTLTVGTQAAPVGTIGGVSPVFQLPEQEEANKKIGKTPLLEAETTDAQDKDNDARGDGEKNGCEDMFWSALRGLGVFGAAALGVGMFSVGVGAALMYVWFTRRNSGPGRTDTAWMSS
eukprot:PLAT12528.3.p2 GENE.PLAT12528.3~~PLAT12528.3.p2  ORF type:complete len:741 (+),score=259.15 PLAT12528.3:76-2298(+)